LLPALCFLAGLAAGAWFIAVHRPDHERPGAIARPADETENVLASALTRVAAHAPDYLPNLVMIIAVTFFKIKKPKMWSAGSKPCTHARARR